MVEINKNTKKAHKIVNDYRYAINRGFRYLEQCYKSNSSAKDRAFIYCENQKEKYNGFNACIISYNSCFFTYGFLSSQDNGKFTLHYITAYHDYCIKDIEKGCFR